MSSTFLGHLVDTSQFRWEGFPLKLEYEYVARKLRDGTRFTKWFDNYCVQIWSCCWRNYTAHYNSTQHELDNTQHSTTQPNKNYATQCWYTTDMTENNCNLQTCVCEYYECITCIVKKITTGQNYQASFNGHNNAV